VSEVAVHEDWNLSAIGLKLTDPDLPFARFEELCFMLGRFHEAVRFAIGDAILIGEKLYGEEVYQALEQLHLSEDGRREYLRVSERVPRSRRRRDLSWSHHRAVAALEPAAQKEWLKRASEEGMSHAEMRDALRNGAEPRAVTTCRCCGRRLDASPE
jgi:hypothetical protein